MCVYTHMYIYIYYIYIYLHVSKYLKHICIWEVYIHISMSGQSLEIRIISGEVLGILTQIGLS